MVNKTIKTALKSSYIEWYSTLLIEWFLTRHSYGRQCVDGSILFGGSRIRCDNDDFDILKEDIEDNLDWDRIG